MTEAEILPHLTEWHQAMIDSDAAIAWYLEPLKLAPDSPLYESIWNLQSAMTKAVSKLVDDQDEWLAWYRFDNDMGKAGREAMIGGKYRKVRTLKQLARVIVESREC